MIHCLFCSLCAFSSQLKSSSFTLFSFIFSFLFLWGLIAEWIFKQWIQRSLLKILGHLECKVQCWEGQCGAWGARQHWRSNLGLRHARHDAKPCSFSTRMGLYFIPYLLNFGLNLFTLLLVSKKNMHMESRVLLKAGQMVFLTGFWEVPMVGINYGTGKSWACVSGSMGFRCKVSLWLGLIIFWITSLLRWKGQFF